jgi:hypothetical protein
MVASTDSVYYREEDGVQRDLQMVFKQCVPVTALRGLLRAAEPLGEAPAREQE